MATEADLSVFGNTTDMDFPLIVVVGREPNNSMEKEHRIGGYASSGATPARQWPSVAFWDRSYGLLGHYLNLSPSQLKAACMDRVSSPIVITDFSPRSLDGSYSPAEKVKIRKTIPTREITDHVDLVLTHDKIFSRTKLVILSGIQGCGFCPDAITHMEERLSDNKISWCHITSLSSQITKHSQRHEELLLHRPRIISTMHEFMSTATQKNQAA